MLYSIIAEDFPESLQLRVQNRPAHLERLKQLQSQGRLVFAGPCPAIDNEDPGPAGFTGSLIIAEFESLDQAKLWASNDPYKLNGVYDRITVKPVKKVFPNND